MPRNTATDFVKPMAVGLRPVLIALVIMATVNVSIATTTGLMSSARAEAPSVPLLGTLPEGEITAVRSTSIDVAGRFYDLHQKLTIVSDEGQPMELMQLKPGMIIQYHVKEGALDQIIVLMLR